MVVWIQASMSAYGAVDGEGSAEERDEGQRFRTSNDCFFPENKLGEDKSV